MLSQCKEATTLVRSLVFDMFIDNDDALLVSTVDVDILIITFKIITFKTNQDPTMYVGIFLESHKNLQSMSII